MVKKQLILILSIMVVIIIGLSVTRMIFQAKAVEANRKALTNDLLYYAAKAREFYWRPSTLGGGNRSFAGLTLPMISTVSSNTNGRYFVVGSPTRDEVVIGGIGTVSAGKDSTLVQVIVNVQSNSFQVIQ